jgi:predicted DNA-binding transcriptional regulator AlpA
MADKKYLPTKAVLERYSITEMSLWRWERDPKVGFPAPHRFGTARKFYDLQEIEAWERRRAADSSGRAA